MYVMNLLGCRESERAISAATAKRVYICKCTGAGRSTCGGTMKFNRFHSWEV